MTKPRITVVTAAATLLILALAACDSNQQAGSDALGRTPSAAAPSAMATPAPGARHVADAASRKLVVYKSPTCGCCTAWVDHMKEHGFAVEVHDKADVTPIKEESGIPQRLHSCHTAFIGGYALEGHVPATDVEGLLRDRPDVTGLAVPGMPMGSPGMEGPVKQRYDVLAFDRAGRTTVFATH
jgi:hypothetical protein